MILVIGGAASGKLTYVRSLGYSDEQMANAVLDEKPVIYNLQDLVASSLETAPQLVEALLTKEIVVCDEVGAGVIPGVKTEREAREACGRLCNQLAEKADTIIRMVAGIPTRLKG
jgi:adenosyl cobinamide kinase/adenosyl cobinamide phosphate guanylyltransferase